MKKQTLAKLATLLISASPVALSAVSAAEPWSEYEWSNGRWVPAGVPGVSGVDQAAFKGPVFRRPSFQQGQQAVPQQAAEQFVAGPNAGPVVYGQQPVAGSPAANGQFVPTEQFVGQQYPAVQHSGPQYGTSQYGASQGHGQQYAAPAYEQAQPASQPAPQFQQALGFQQSGQQLSSTPGIPNFQQELDAIAQEQAVAPVTYAEQNGSVVPTSGSLAGGGVSDPFGSGRGQYGSAMGLNTGHAVENYGGQVYGSESFAGETVGATTFDGDQPIVYEAAASSGEAVPFTYQPSIVPRNTSFNVLAEGLFYDRANTFDSVRNFSDGPNNSGFGYDDVVSGGYSTGWRIVGEMLFHDPCDACAEWVHGIGVSYFDPGAVNEAAGGTFQFGIAFDAGTKGTDPSTLAGCFVLSQDTFFASLARVASINTLISNEQEEFEGLGPDPSTTPLDPTRTTGSETFALPTWQAGYESRIYAIGAHTLLAKQRGQRMKFGMGWKHFNVNENSFVLISGPMHATDATFFGPGFPLAPADRNNGLEHGSFLDNTRNDGSNPGLVYLGPPGSEDGFDAQNDGTAGVTDGVGPDLLALFSGQTAHNRLNGVNFFASSTILGNDRFNMSGRIDLGLYHNRAEASVAERYTELTSNGSAYGRTLTDSSDVVSMVAVTSLDVGYWLTEWLRVYGGYEVMFLSGLALAPEQESGLVGTSYELQHDGDLILQGVKVGLEAQF